VAAFLLPAIVVGIVLHFLRGGAVLRVACGVVLGLLAVGAILLTPSARRFRKEMTANTLLF
jgi:hypothetical protein